MSAQFVADVGGTNIRLARVTSDAAWDERYAQLRAEMSSDPAQPSKFLIASAVFLFFVMTTPVQ